MLGMVRVEIQRLTVGIFRDETCVERPLEMQNIAADFEALDVRDHTGKGPQSGDVIIALVRRRFRPVLPANNMDEHLGSILQSLALFLTEKEFHAKLAKFAKRSPESYACRLCSAPISVNSPIANFASFALDHSALR